MLSYTRKAFLGPVTRSDIKQVFDLKPREIALLFIPGLLVLIFGLFPDYILNINQSASEAWLSRLTIQTP
jgi:NADH-quinone oxidoreductase subunit M